MPGDLNDPDDPLDPSSRTWWQSESSIEEVSLTLNLDGFYYLGGVQVNFRPPAPSAVVIEASQDFGEKYAPLQYYSDDCLQDFNLPTTTSLESAGNKTEIICTSDYSSSGDNDIVSGCILKESGTSDKGPSEKRTASLERTFIMSLISHSTFFRPPRRTTSL